ncbi:hypothetical protein K503DRAFT_696262, partial [Rhizopogon vinicolor AM-OR11-026]
PPASSGEIKIYGRDLNKLQPNRFLNDTLIEFGLKLWHADIKRRNNDLADEIHIFSPFFYTTLTHRKMCIDTTNNGKYGARRTWIYFPRNT